MTDPTDRTDGAYQVLASFPFAVLVHRDGKIVFANAEAVAMHRAGSTEQLVGRDPFALVHPDYHARILARREDAPGGESFEHKRLRIDGSEFIAKTRTSQILWEGVRSTLVAIRDTTQRSKDIEALRESERRYRDLIEGSTFGIQISRPNGERLFVNRKFVEMFGYDSAEEMLGITEPGALIAPHDRERIVANRTARAAGEPAPEFYEYDALRKDGSFLPVQVFFPSCLLGG
ncbi:MAG: PAS domain-containing protein [Proteobacteria bacterium]|nr:PAS domain-containing protein [Pseudomonadota bacterium]